MESAIFSLPALQRSKCLDHGEWRDELPRKILPSDIDAVCNDRERFLLWEIDTETCLWPELTKGQRWTYEEFVKMGKGLVTAALVLVPPLREAPLINTYRDVIRFSVMHWNDGKICVHEPCDGKRWRTFVKTWFARKVIWKCQRGLKNVG